jgi:glutamyl-Q tRNA(Asp) synthetase
VHTTRFAPSPTGLLHLGHAFAALTAFDAAAGGRFLVRIEDLDLGRARAEHETAILEDLRWLELRWETPLLHQSERTDAYLAAIASLTARELLYPCFCTRKEIAAEIARAGQAPHEREQQIYPGTCRTLGASERARRIGGEAAYALRLDVARAAEQSGSLEFVELGAGPNGEHGVMSVDPLLFGDFVVARKDLPAAYHLAVVVDDAFQGVTLVTRGNDLFAAAHIQRLLQVLLGLPVPQYAHHRLILDARGQKISKRDRPATLRALREQGGTPAQIRERLGLARGAGGAGRAGGASGVQPSMR